MLASLAEKYIVPLLSDHNFQRAGLIWNRTMPGIVHVLDVQVSRWRGEEKVQFTMNLGVWVEQVWRICWDKAVPKTVEESDCFPRLRVGRLIGCDKDVWWTLGDSSDVDRIGIELQGVLLHRCIPFLDNLKSIGAIVALAEAPALRKDPADLLSYAILKHLAGAPAEARQLLSGLLANVRLKGWHDRVRSVAERLASVPGPVY